LRAPTVRIATTLQRPPSSSHSLHWFIPTHCHRWQITRYRELWGLRFRRCMSVVAGLKKAAQACRLPVLTACRCRRLPSSCHFKAPSPHEIEE
jgi:hypothetical protein